MSTTNTSPPIRGAVEQPVPLSGAEGPHLLLENQRARIEALVAEVEAGIDDIVRQREEFDSSILDDDDRGLSFAESMPVADLDAVERAARTDRLDFRERELASLAQQLQELRSSLDARSDNLRRRQRGYDLQSAELIAAGTTVLVQRSMLRAEAMSWSRRQSQLKAHAQDLLSQAKSFEQRETDLTRRDAELGARDADLRDRLEALDRQAAALARERSGIGERARELSRREAALDQREAAVAERERRQQEAHCRHERWAAAESARLLELRDACEIAREEAESECAGLRREQAEFAERERALEMREQGVAAKIAGLRAWLNACEHDEDGR